MREHASSDEDQEHQRTTPQHQLSTPNVIAQVDCQSQTGGVTDKIAAGKDSRLVPCVSRQREHLGSVGGDEINTSELLHDLHAGAQEDPSACMEFVVFGQHAPVRGRFLAGFEADRGDNLTQLLVDLAVLGIQTGSLQDGSGFVNAPRLQQVPGRFGVERGRQDDEQKKDDLQCEREPPCE